MKKNKVLAIGLIIIMTITLLIGCGKKDPKEIIEEVVENSTKIQTAEQNVEMNINLNIPSKDPMTAIMLQMLNNIKLDMHIVTDDENMQSLSDMTLNLGGMAYNIKAYSTKENVIMKLPMIPQYVVQEQTINLNDKEGLNDITNKLTEAMLDSIKDENIKINGEKTISTPEGDVKVKELVMSFSNDEAKEVMKEIVNIMFENEEMSKLLEENIKKNLELKGETVTDEKVQIRLKETKENFKNGFTNFEQELTIDKLNVVYLVDKNNTARGSEFEISISGRNEETGQDILIDLNGKSKIWNINKKVKIEIPEINKENSIKMQDLGSELLKTMPLGQ